MKLCGLTGGVGMGKSTAAGFFFSFGPGGGANRERGAETLERWRLSGGGGKGQSPPGGFFLQFGARVVDTDELAHELVLPGQPALAEIQNEFGNNIIAARSEEHTSELQS